MLKPGPAAQSAPTTVRTNTENSIAVYGGLSTLSFVVGGAAATAGVIWYLVARPRSPAHATTGLWPHLAALPDGALAGVSGSF